MAKRPKTDDTISTLEKAAEKIKYDRYVLRLYVAGINPKSSAAIRSITEICEQFLWSRLVSSTCSESFVVCCSRAHTPFLSSRTARPKPLRLGTVISSYSRDATTPSAPAS